MDTLNVLMENYALRIWRDLFPDTPYDHYWWEIHNPESKQSPDYFEARFNKDMWNRKARDRVCEWFSWAIPSTEALEALKGLSERYEGILEIGAGRGYWARLLSDMGMDVKAYDSHPPALYRNHWCGEVQEMWYPVKRGGPLRVKQWANHLLLMVWPAFHEVNNKCMDYEALRNYTGKEFVFVGEDGGCTGTPKFWDLVKAEWEQTQSIDIPQWDGIHDYLFVFARRENQ